MSKSNWLIEKRKIDRRVEFMVLNKLPYFQPTISPAPKMKNEIESVDTALDYFNNLCDEVFVQVKYMGSYILARFERDHESTTFFSRNGYEIKNTRVEGLHEATKQLHSKLLEEFDFDTILVEGELLPWRAMGSSLIDGEFGDYGKLHKNHCTFMSINTAVDKIRKIRRDKPWERTDLKEHERKQYNSIRNIDIPNISEYSKSIKLYLDQLENFGGDAPLEFKPFNVLKYSSRGYEHRLYEHVFLGPDSDCIRISTLDKKSAREFFNTCQTNNLEGVMIKPVVQQRPEFVPCLKVRNRNYLQLIYGVNFNSNFDYYYEKRCVARKMSQSMKQYRIACEMLEIPFSDLNKCNSNYINLLYSAIDCEHFNKQLDSRL